MTPLRQRMIRDLTIRGRAQPTIRNYTQAVERLARFYHCSPDLISEEEVQDYLYYLVNERNNSESTLNVTVSALRFLYGKTLKRAKGDFVIPAAKSRNKLPSVLSRDEVERIFDCTNNLRDLALLMLAYGDGLRISEAVQILVSDIDGSRKAIHIRNGKGGKDRMGGLAERLHKTLQEYWKAYRPELWLFPSPKLPGFHICTETARAIFVKAKVKAKITKDCSFHVLRHSFATHLLEAGKGLREIQRLMGHKSLTSTLIYIHIAQGGLQQFDSPLDLPPSAKV